MVDYETLKRYYDGLWQQNQDAIINALNNGTLKIGTEEWRAIMNKSGDLRGQKEAFHMGKMGMLDGEMAQEASEQTTVPAGHEYAFGTGGVSGNAAGHGGSGGGYKGVVSFSANNRQDMYVGLENDGSIEDSDSYNFGRYHAYGNSGVDIKQIEGMTVEEESSETNYLSEANFLTEMEKIDAEISNIDTIIAEREAYTSGLVAATSYTAENYNQAISGREALESQRDGLKEQRDLSIEVEDFSNNAYLNEEDAAVVFA